MWMRMEAGVAGDVIVALSQHALRYPEWISPQLCLRVLPRTAHLLLARPVIPSWRHSDGSLRALVGMEPVRSTHT